MVGPTCVQAGPVCLVTSFSLLTICGCFFGGKGELSAPLASRGSLVRDGVSKKLDAGRMIEKGLRVPHGM